MPMQNGRIGERAVKEAAAALGGLLAILFLTLLAASITAYTP